jgi:hypothetical protein
MRWTNERGLLEVVDRHAMTVTEEDPKRFYALSDFNRMEDSDGNFDPWLEHEFLGSLDNDVANLMPQLENLPNPRSLRKLKRRRDWHPTHILSRSSTVRLAMYVAAQAVRSPTWREAVYSSTAAEIKRYVEEKAQAGLATATDPAEIERLNKLLGLRYLVNISGNMMPHLSGHLAYRIGEVLYQRYSWTIWHFPAPVLLLGNDPVLLINRNPAKNGSFSQVATADSDKLSVWRDIGPAAEHAVAAVQDADFVVLPLDPTRALVLCGFGAGLPQLPGRHEVPLDVAKELNRLMSIASADWLGMPPGHMDVARKQLEERYPWLSRLRA